MPTLDFTGKQLVWEYHLTVPDQALIAQPDLSIGTDPLHQLIEGDNLYSLKALLPTHRGKVKLIYIDPPYNTGESHWVYNDQVNNPMMEAWIGKVVGRDDLSRHDKWLCMMTPRLRLMRELLKDDGVLLVSISDLEMHHLRLLLDEIFGAEHFVNVFVWQSRTSKANDTDLSVSHEYILAYAKNRRKMERRLRPKNQAEWHTLPSFAYHPLPLAQTRFSNPDKDPRGPWKADPFDAPNIRPNLTYPITNPNTGKVYWPPAGRCWRTEPEKFEVLLAEGRIVFGKKGTARPQLKVFYEEKKGLGEVESSWLPGNDFGTTTVATRQLKKLFDGKKVFNHPKPVSLLKHLLSLVMPSGAEIVLDCFAGSGSTGHAVLDFNREQGTAHQFILMQSAEGSSKHPNRNNCREITRERLARAIQQEEYPRGVKYALVKPGS